MNALRFRIHFPLTQISLPLLGLVLAAPRISDAATTYYVGPNGEASAAGTSREAPATLGGVVGKLAPGDVVIFLDGVYLGTETTLLSQSGTASAPITFRAEDGAVPILRGQGGRVDNIGAIAASTDIGYLVFEGLWFEEWSSGAIELDWEYKGCHDITIRYCVADRNGRNGFAPYNASNVTIEYNIGSRNGYRDDSWSSNFNLWGNRGQVTVRGNVAFHGLDTSSNKSDGNGYILDLTLANARALFENNIGFGNGGACIAITDSGNATLIGNTCYNNSKDTNTDDFNFVNTCRGDVDGVNVGQQAWTFSGLSASNNVLSGGVKTIPGSCGGGSASYSQSNNQTGANAGAVFENADAGDFRPKAGSAIVDKVSHGSTFATDIGFDPKCIKRETDEAKKQGMSWWTHAPDLEYIQSIGGIKKCWSPRTRPQGSNQEIGAYELAVEGCTTAASCADEDDCTDDACDPDGECTHTPKADCGATDAGDGNEGGAGALGNDEGGAAGDGENDPGLGGDTDALSDSAQGGTQADVGGATSGGAEPADRASGGSGPSGLPGTAGTDAVGPAGSANAGTATRTSGQASVVAAATAGRA
ncbi:right-handed parallel beta-helix repeat-containing protein, partial [Myxococcota bacterium]